MRSVRQNLNLGQKQECCWSVISVKRFLHNILEKGHFWKANRDNCKYNTYSFWHNSNVYNGKHLMAENPKQTVWRYKTTEGQSVFKTALQKLVVRAKSQAVGQNTTSSKMSRKHTCWKAALHISVNFYRKTQLLKQTWCDMLKGSVVRQCLYHVFPPEKLLDAVAAIWLGGSGGSVH